MLKPLFIIFGSISLILGIIGIVIPGLPTTPFLLLSAGLYVRSSARLYAKLINHPVLGAYIKKYRENKGIDRKTKWFSIVLMWVMVLMSAFVFVNSGTARYVILTLGVVGTVCMVFIPTIK